MTKKQCTKPAGWLAQLANGARLMFYGARLADWTHRNWRAVAEWFDGS